MRMRKSSHKSDEYFGSQHSFEHWYRDNSIYFITARCRGQFPAFASEKAKAIFKAKDDKCALAMAMLNIANALSSLDRIAESDRHYAAAERLSRQMDMPELLTQAKYNRAYLRFLGGRYSDALKAFAALRRQFNTQQSLRHAALCDLDEAEIYLQLNVSADAATLAQRAIVRAVCHSFGILRTRLRTGWADLSFESGFRLDQAFAAKIASGARNRSHGYQAAFAYRKS